ncbi:MAG: hypothetical protein IKB70_02455 [Bacilli bacterium]|nr:hypothetical protein [Bacilli bacterium]
MSKKVKDVKKRKWWFRLLKKLMKCRYKKPRLIYLGDDFKDGSIIISNHEGTDAPMALEIYVNRKMRMWGAYEMNSGLATLYKYQTRVYYHEKKKWNLHLARLFCLIASPLTYLFYRGLNLISTYKDLRFKKTIDESISTIKNGENVVIFPEDSTNGYLPQLENLFKGFIFLAESCEREGVDVPIVVSFFKIKENAYIFDQPILYSEVKEKYKTREEIAKYFLLRCNELGRKEI